MTRTNKIGMTVLGVAPIASVSLGSTIYTFATGSALDRLIIVGTVAWFGLALWLICRGKKKASMIVSHEARLTLRGFTKVAFADLYEQRCSVQESSLATQSALWLGVDNTGPHMGNEQVNGRMHINQDHAEWLITVLSEFVKTGELSRFHKALTREEERAEHIDKHGCPPGWPGETSWSNSAPILIRDPG